MRHACHVNGERVRTSSSLFKYRNHNPAPQPGSGNPVPDYHTYRAIWLDGVLGQGLDLAPIDERLRTEEPREQVAEAGQLLAVQLKLK